MVRASYLTAAITAGLLNCNIAQAGPDDDLREKVRQLQSSERLLTASIAARDEAEFKHQNDTLFELIKWYKYFEERKQFPDCGKAFFSLFFFGNGLARQSSAQDYIELQNRKSEYQASAPLCEARLDLTPPAKPNLR